ncbi:MAG: HAMP domain-containing histidine kinase [Dactylosporangium sp.]|nr:HAMP domain-containing histidine kinase [Dactylosporangium sp.]NNJ62669.1 HAMP domain-containing histidine kinase [Dactylosporangium sp.]
MAVLAWGPFAGLTRVDPVLLAGIGLGTVCGLTAVGGHLVASRALRPLRQVTTMARRLSGETLDERIGCIEADDEVAELAATFDALLDRVGAAVASQKRFVANASHELRTPLAVMRTEIEVTLGDPDADIAEYRRMAVVVRDASIRANSLVESLLLLARTEAQAGRRLVRKVPLDLRASAEAALSAVRQEAGRLNLDIRTDFAAAPVVGDPDLLERLAGNLIENAVRYNHFAGELTVTADSDEASAWLTVRNTGFEVDKDDIPALFEPFRRGGMERTGYRGCGLGLSIVRAVCDAHGGSVSASALAEGGLEVTVRLPSAGRTPVLAGSAAVEGGRGGAVATPRASRRRPAPRPSA